MMNDIYNVFLGFVCGIGFALASIMLDNIWMYIGASMGIGFAMVGFMNFFKEEAKKKDEN